MLAALAETGGLAAESTQVIQFRAPHAPGAHHVDMIDHPRMDWEDALHTLAEADLANGDALAHAGIIAGDDGAFKRLEALFIAFLDLYVDTDRVARAKLGDIGPLVLVNKLRQQRCLHGNLVLNFLVYTNLQTKSLATNEHE